MTFNGSVVHEMDVPKYPIAISVVVGRELESHLLWSGSSPFFHMLLGQFGLLFATLS